MCDPGSILCKDSQNVTTQNITKKKEILNFVFCQMEVEWYWILTGKDKHDGIRKMILGLPLRNIIVNFCFSKKWFGTIWMSFIWFVFFASIILDMLLLLLHDMVSKRQHSMYLFTYNAFQGCHSMCSINLQSNLL